MAEVAAQGEISGADLIAVRTGLMRLTASYISDRAKPTPQQLQPELQTDKGQRSSSVGG